MVDVSSPGRAAPKVKSINVEANLLSERIAERERLLDTLSRKAVAALLVLVMAAITLPASYRLQSRMAAKAESVQQTEAALARDLGALKTELDSTKPMMQDNQMMGTSRTYSHNFMHQLISFLNASGSSMVFSSVKGEVLGGELKISASADAETYAAARDFVDTTGKTDRTKSSVLKLWRHNPDFGPNGVTFEVEKMAVVGQ